jgi:hypothetical protein
MLSNSHQSFWQRLPRNITTHYHGPSYPTAITLIGKDCCKTLSYILTVSHSTAINLIGKDCHQTLPHTLINILIQQPHSDGQDCCQTLPHIFTVNVLNSHHSDWQRLLLKIATHLHIRIHPKAILTLAPELAITGVLQDSHSAQHTTHTPLPRHAATPPHNL